MESFPGGLRRSRALRWFPVFQIMRGRALPVLSFAIVALLVAAAVLAFRAYWQVREIREEEKLESVAIDSLDIRGATFDEALRLVVERVHAEGHPELRLRIYANGRDCAYFHGAERTDSSKNAAKVDLSITPDPIGRSLNFRGWKADGASNHLEGSAGQMQILLRDVLGELELEFNLPCAVRGHDLVAAHTPGTLQRFVETSFPLSEEFLKENSDPALADLVRKSGAQFYEGMRVEFRRQQGDVFVFAPRNQVMVLDDLFSSHAPARR